MRQLVSEQASEEDARGEVSILLLRALMDVLQQRGIAVDALLAQATESVSVASSTSRLPLASFEALLARASKLANEPALGLLTGLHAAESSFGLVGPLVSHTSTLRRALELMGRFHSLLLEGAHLYVSECMGVATLRCEFPRTSQSANHAANQAADRQLAELIVAGVTRTVRSFGCGRSDIRAVCFEHVRPSYAHAYTAAFHGVERFACSFTGVEINAQALDRPHIHRQPELELLLCAEAERALQSLGRPASATEQVLESMRCQRRGEPPEMRRIARELGVSVRSLRRRLAEEGTSFRELTQSALQEAACSMLRDPRVTPQNIAHALGFAHAAAFRRAFKRWTQLTPAEFRESARHSTQAAAAVERSA